MAGRAHLLASDRADDSEQCSSYCAEFVGEVLNARERGIRVEYENKTMVMQCKQKDQVNG